MSSSANANNAVNEEGANNNNDSHTNINHNPNPNPNPPNSPANPPAPKQPITSFLIDFTSASVSTTLSKSVSAPLERVKILLQIQPELIKNGVLGRPFEGFFDCVLRVFIREGILGFFRGNLINAIRPLATQTLNFLLKDKLKLSSFDKKSYWKTFLTNILSGALAGSSSLLFVYPLDTIKTILMCDVKRNGAYHFQGILDVLKQVLRKNGIEGLYQGFLVSILGIIVYRAVYFGLYDSIKKFFKVHGVLASFSVGVFVTLVAGMLAYPLDTLRTRMMLAAVFGKAYKTSFHALKDIVTTEGFGSLWSGARVRVLSTIFSTLVLVGYDALTKSRK
eukprot:TRINITY_DN5238_c0_g1_i3.p2 TRINITY_DN5238_c0_g1~~TRINITY_DN5238_c0_g1_i3.p2  ORF type:complete len:335 (+),score=40.38 TRINITY_DN5238_c0_g1_i3:1503-2507(+)